MPIYNADGVLDGLNIGDGKIVYWLHRNEDGEITSFTEDFNNGEHIRDITIDRDPITGRITKVYISHEYIKPVEPTFSDWVPGTIDPDTGTWHPSCFDGTNWVKAYTTQPWVYARWVTPPGEWRTDTSMYTGKVPKGSKDAGTVPSTICPKGKIPESIIDPTDVPPVNPDNPTTNPDNPPVDPIGVLVASSGGYTNNVPLSKEAIWTPGIPDPKYPKVTIGSWTFFPMDEYYAEGTSYFLNNEPTRMIYYGYHEYSPVLAKWCSWLNRYIPKYWYWHLGDKKLYEAKFVSANPIKFEMVEVPDDVSLDPDAGTDVPDNPWVPPEITISPDIDPYPDLYNDVNDIEIFPVIKELEPTENQKWKPSYWSVTSNWWKVFNRDVDPHEWVGVEITQDTVNNVLNADEYVFSSAVIPRGKKYFGGLSELLGNAFKYVPKYWQYLNRPELYVLKPDINKPKSEWLVVADGVSDIPEDPDEEDDEEEDVQNHVHDWGDMDYSPEHPHQAFRECRLCTARKWYKQYDESTWADCPG